MDYSHEIPTSKQSSESTLYQQPSDSADSRSLLVDFQWKNMKILITSPASPDPIYIVDCKYLGTVMNFHYAGPGNTEIEPHFATSRIHAVQIKADCTIHNKTVDLIPLRRLYTEYTHSSPAFADAAGTRQPMRWSSGCGFKTWDFVCCDAQQNPVARFSANNWRVKKVGKIEFMGPLAMSDAVRDEILVTGLTLYACMAVRVNNIGNLVGAIFTNSGKNQKEFEKSNLEFGAGKKELEFQKSFDADKKERITAKEDELQWAT